MNFLTRLNFFIILLALSLFSNSVSAKKEKTTEENFLNFSFSFQSAIFKHGSYNVYCEKTCENRKKNYLPDPSQSLPLRSQVGLDAYLGGYIIGSFLGIHSQWTGYDTGSSDPL